MSERADDILLKEYAEAGHLCRWYEQLTRTTLMIYLPLSTTLIGYLQKAENTPGSRLILALSGFIISVLLVNTVFRQKAYYLSYIKRAKEIEINIVEDSQPIMRLYTDGVNATKVLALFQTNLQSALSFGSSRSISSVRLSHMAIKYTAKVFNKSFEPPRAAQLVVHVQATLRS